MRRPLSIVLALLLLLAVLGYSYLTPRRGPGRNRRRAELTTLLVSLKLREGDLIFHTSQSAQSRAIQLATHSPYSHCGMLLRQGGEWQVLEAVQPVGITPMEQWITRGQGGHFVVKRLRDALRPVFRLVRRADLLLRAALEAVPRSHRPADRPAAEAARIRPLPPRRAGQAARAVRREIAPRRAGYFARPDVQQPGAAHGGGAVGAAVRWATARTWRSAPRRSLWRSAGFRGWPFHPWRWYPGRSNPRGRGGAATSHAGPGRSGR
jgi:Permuted papain-like amidase enzyme, YaeF/YiiX, C92 family